MFYSERDAAGVGRPPRYTVAAVQAAAVGTICLTDNVYQGPGTYTFRWWGTGPDGAFLPPKGGANVILNKANYPQNV